MTLGEIQGSPDEIEARDAVEAVPPAPLVDQSSPVQPPMKSGKAVDILINVVLVIAGLVGIIIVWQIIVSVTNIPKYVLPPPLDVAHALVNDYSDLARGLATTLEETVLAFLIAVVSGVLIAFAITFSRVADRLVRPLVVGSQAVPVIAVAPLIIAWFGIGLNSKLVIGALIAIFPIIINTSTGLKGIDPNLINLARAMGGSKLAIFLKLRIPFALPTMFAGLKLAMAFSMIGVVIGEFVAGQGGLGYLIETSAGNLELAVTYAGIIILIALGMVLYLILSLLEAKFVFWK